MNLNSAQKTILWLIGLIAIGLLFFRLSTVMTPFVIGAAVAYFLDPVADRMQAKGLSRILSVTIISLVMLAVLVLAILFLLPVIAHQFTSLIASLPDYWAALNQYVSERFPNFAARAAESLQNVSEQYQTQIQNAILGFFDQAMSSVQGIVTYVGLLLIIPVVSIYLLIDWDRMVEYIDNMIPRDSLNTIRYLAKEIDKTLASFVRGQVLVCMFLGTFYSITLMLAGLNFGLIIGIIAGALTFIPYLGAMIGGALAIGVAIYQFWGEWGHVALVAGIFFLGQFLEGNIVTPKLVGKSVGLHPVWLLFALSAFASLYGFIGMLIAVPVAACFGVIGRFMLGRYQHSEAYLGKAGEVEDFSPEAVTPLSDDEVDELTEEVYKKEPS